MDIKAAALLVPVITLSLDIAINCAFGNVLSPFVRGKLIDYIRAGAVIGLIMGPPCETWSAARFLELLCGSRGPRPIRSEGDLWGLPDLSKRETEQIEIGNALLRLALVLFAHMLSSGFGTALIEHPALAAWAPIAAPSIWKLPEIQWLLRHGARLVQIDQCRFGAPSKKPTTLLTCHAAALWSRHPRSLCCSCTAPHATTLGGGKADGIFKTAAAKTYPPPLCELIADTIIDSLIMRHGVDRQHGPWQNTDDFIVSAHAPWDITAEQDCMWDLGYAPDFHKESLLTS